MHGQQIWPDGPTWDYPPLAARPPLSKYEICTYLPGEFIEDSPGIAPADTDQSMEQPRTTPASATSAQLGATPAS
eukprot:4075760-Pyramimonas_sp.AAC.1